MELGDYNGSQVSNLSLIVTCILGPAYEYNVLLLATTSVDRTESNCPLCPSPPRAGVHDPGLNWVVDVEYMLDGAQGRY